MKNFTLLASVLCTTFLLYNFYWPANQDTAAPLDLPAYDEALASARAIDKPLLLYFYGWKCKNVLAENKLVFNDPTIKKAIEDDLVFLPLDVTDRKPLAEKIPHRTKQGKEVLIRTQGALHGYFELAKFNNRTQPYFVILDLNENMLHSAGYLPNRIDLLNFLEDGVRKFRY